MVRPVFATSLKLAAKLAVRVLESSQSSAEVVEVKSAFQSQSSLQMAVPCLRGSHPELWQNKTDILS